MKKTLILVAALIGATTLMPAPQAEAAWSIFGGKTHNSSSSTLPTVAKCHNGEVWHTNPGNDDPCGDTDAYYVPAYGRTYQWVNDNRSGPAGHWALRSDGWHSVANLSPTVKLKRIR